MIPSLSLQEQVPSSRFAAYCFVRLKLVMVLYFQALSGDCGFMAANMYAKSIFGEDVLANLSIEKPAHLPQNAPVQGHIRIRAKSQVCVRFASSPTRILHIFSWSDFQIYQWLLSEPGPVLLQKIFSVQENLKSCTKISSTGR